MLRKRGYQASEGVKAKRGAEELWLPLYRFAESVLLALGVCRDSPLSAWSPTFNFLVIAGLYTLT